MRSFLVVLLSLLLVFPLLASQRSRDRGATVVSPLKAKPDRPLITAGIDTLVLADYDFEDGMGGPDPQGWTSLDYSVQADTFFHVDNFAGLLAPYGALRGSKSLWCGVRPNHPGLCDYVTPPGYGNGWRQLFVSAAFVVSGDVSVSYLARYDMEDSWDYAYLEYESKTGAWQQLISYTGTGETLATDVIPADSLLGTVTLRFRFYSDGVWSDEDALYDYDSDGGIVIDSLSVYDDGGLVDYQDFESESTGALATSDGHWWADVPAPFGDYAGLFDGSAVLQEDTLVTNNSHLWGFFNGSTFDYGCGGHPEQPAVPPPTASNSINNWVYSPEIPLSVWVDTLLFEVGVYSTVEWGTAFRWRIDGSWTCWTPDGPSLLFLRRWVHEIFPMDVPPGAQSVQVAVRVEESMFFPGCRSHVPLWDDVRIVALVPYDFLVTNTADSGPGSLRQAIIDANANPGSDIIDFDIPGAGPHVIQPVTALPTITEAAQINGYTQAGAAINTLDRSTGGNAVIKIVLDGSLAPAGTSGITLGSQSSSVRGLAIGNFTEAGVRISANGCSVLGNYIGTDATGAVAAPNGTGVVIDSGFINGFVGGGLGNRNIISGNLGAGVETAGGYFIEGNFIGTDPTGNVALPNQGAAVAVVAGTGNHVGASYGDDANLIAYDGPGGVVVTGASTTCEILNNWIWTESSANPGIDLGGDGVTANDSSDTDSGPNTLLNYPVITSAMSSGDETQIRGEIVGAEPVVRTYDVQLFVSPNASPRQGRQLVGGAWVTSVTTDATGYATFSDSISGYTPPSGWWVTATATYDGYTSEYSAPFQMLNTPVGTNVSVEIHDEGSDAVGYLQFDEVTVSGLTSMIVSSTGPPPPSGFQLNDPTTYFEFTTDATYVDSIMVCAAYDEADLQGPESELRLMHYDTLLAEPDWVDITTQHYPVENFVCGRVAHFSPFVMGVTTVSGIENTPKIPAAFALQQNVPNPFNPTTTIAFDVPLDAGLVTLAIYDVAGRLVRALVDEDLSPGYKSVSWDGRSQRGQMSASGVYFYRLTGNGFSATKKMVLLK